MGEGYRVVLDDVQQLAAGFHREATALEGLRGRSDGPAPDTGDVELTGLLSDVLDNLSALYSIVVATLHSHSERLDATASAYAKAEIDNHELFNRIQSAYEGTE